MKDKLLNRAIRIWRNGYPIPVDMWMNLAAKGYDMPTLEDKYLNN